MEPGFLPSTINWSPFSDIKAFGKCDFFDLFSLTGHFPAVPFYIITCSCLRLSLSSCPVYLLFLSHQTTNPSLPPHFFFLFWRCHLSFFLYHSSYFSPTFISFHFSCLWHQCNAPCRAFGCIISFEYLYTEMCAYKWVYRPDYVCVRECVSWEMQSKCWKGCISNLSSHADLVKSIRISRDLLISVKICKCMHKHTHRDKKSRRQKAQIRYAKSNGNSYYYHFYCCCNKSKKNNSK